MPVLTDEEVNTVRESCRQLGAIGRNLNQVARALNIEFRESDKLKQEAIEKLAERIDQHLDHVSELFTYRKLKNQSIPLSTPYAT
ncbi:plasmid mobilization relaxosome protein MobC [Klebsiella pneumoniae]